MEEVILTLCLSAVLDLCSVHPLSLAVKHSVLAPCPAHGCKASVGQALSLIPMCLLLLTHSLVVFILGSVKWGPCSVLSCSYGGVGAHSLSDLGEVLSQSAL